MFVNVLTTTTAALIPGLGFVLMGQYRRALVAALLTFVPGGFALWGSRGEFSLISGSIAVGAWLVQLYVTADTAQLLSKRTRSNFVPVKTLEPIVVPPELTTDADQARYRAQEITRQQVQSGETLLAFVTGLYKEAWDETGTALVFPNRSCYAGVTERQIIVIELDFLGLSMVVERIHRDQVVKVEFVDDLTAYRLILDVGKKRPAEITASSTHDECEAFYQIFQQ